MPKLNRITELAHYLAAPHIREGDLAVDATAGRGQDTLFLARKVGPAGYVYAFDIQKKALEQTGELLQGKKLLGRVRLIHSGHEGMGQFVRVPVAAVMFNLGYLPGGNRGCTTLHKTTAAGLAQAVDMIRDGGIITMVFYPGHREGKEEQEALLPLLEALPASRFTVIRICLLNRSATAPDLVVVQKDSFSTAHNEQGF